MPVETNTEVDEIEGVKDKDGQTVPAASATGQGDYSGVYTEDLSVPDTTEQTPASQAVPVGAEVVVHAHPDNSGRGFVGGANGDGAVLPLAAGASATFSVDNTDAIRVQGASSGDRFIIAVEVA